VPSKQQLKYWGVMSNTLQWIGQQLVESMRVDAWRAGMCREALPRWHSSTTSASRLLIHGVSSFVHSRVFCLSFRRLFFDTDAFLCGNSIRVIYYVSCHVITSRHVPSSLNKGRQHNESDLSSVLCLWLFLQTQ